MKLITITWKTKPLFLKRLMVFAIAIVTACPIFAQQSRSNHEKYWYFRNRLKDKFIRIGPEEGESLPAGIRHVDYQPSVGYIKALSFGDGTIYLGWYIGVLATEIYLLRNTGQDYTETTSELYYALLAFDRLDMNSEILWSNWNGVVPSGENEPDNMGSISEAPWNASTYNWTGTAQPLNGFFAGTMRPPILKINSRRANTSLCKAE